jgi:hypothetical protein
MKELKAKMDELLALGDYQLARAQELQDVDPAMALAYVTDAGENYKAAKAILRQLKTLTTR